MAAVSIPPLPPPPNNPQLASRQGIPPSFGKRIQKENDFYGWLLDQAWTLRRCAQTSVDLQIDWADLAEELEGMARNEERSLRSQIERVLVHLLKWKFQSQRRSRSWKVSIENGRDEINDLLRTSPSLKSKLSAFRDFAYTKARRTASDEMGCDESTLPVHCPWEDSEIISDSFFPNGCTI